MHTLVGSYSGVYISHPKRTYVLHELDERQTSE